MKRITTQLIVALLTLACLWPTPTQAQDFVEVSGYVNVFVRLQAAVPGSGRVSATPPSGGLDSFKETVDFKQTMPVAAIIDAVYFQSKSRASAGYAFVGWYLDNGDGQLDPSADEQLSNEANPLMTIPVSLLGVPESSIYATEAEAKAAAMPTEPQLTIFAYFTNGAVVDVDYKMGQGVGSFNLGTVEISKPVNQPGDQVTVKAIASEGCRFEYWKTGYGSQWGTEQPNTVVSHDPEFTFTVQGGEHYYAYFSREDAPEIDFPEEGGWYVGAFKGCWILHELSDARIFVPSFTDDRSEDNRIVNDLIVDQQQRAYLDQGDTNAWFDNTINNLDPTRADGRATLIYGKGKVRFTHDFSSWVNFDRTGNVLNWSGNKGATVSDPNHVHNYYVYAFQPDLAAFVKIGTTDEWADDYSATVSVPAQTCFISVEALQIADPETDYIPNVIGLTPEAFDQAVSGIEKPQTKTLSLGGYRFYTLDGKQLSSPRHKGIHIVDGKKVFVNK